MKPIHPDNAKDVVAVGTELESVVDTDRVVLTTLVRVQGGDKRVSGRRAVLRQLEASMQADGAEPGAGEWVVALIPVRKDES